MDIRVRIAENRDHTLRGTLVLDTLDEQSDAIVVNLADSGAKAGEEWYATIVFDERKGRSRTRHVKLLRRVGGGVDGLITTLGDDFWVDPRQLRNLQIFVKAGRTVILRGLAGTGKTTLAERLATAMKLKFAKVDVGLRAEAKQFFGEEGAADGTTSFVLSDFASFLGDAFKAIEAAKRNGGVTHLALLDELNRVHPKIVSGALHGLFDDTRRVTIPTSTGPKAVELPRNAAVICTINPNTAGFAGTFALDAAMMNRAVVMDITFPPKEFEVSLLIGRLNREHRLELSRTDAIRIVEAASQLREAAAGGTLPLAPSPRNTLDCALLTASGVPCAEAIADVLLQPYEGAADQAETERGMAALAVRAKDAGARN